MLVRCIWDFQRLFSLFFFLFLFFIWWDTLPLLKISFACVVFLSSECIQIVASHLVVDKVDVVLIAKLLAILSVIVDFVFLLLSILIPQLHNQNLSFLPPHLILQDILLELIVDEVKVDKLGCVQVVKMFDFAFKMLILLLVFWLHICKSLESLFKPI